MIKGIELIPISIAEKLNCKSIKKLANNNKKRNITASIFEIFFFGCWELSDEKNSFFMYFR